MIESASNTTDGAVELARNFISNGKTKQGNLTAVKSSLCYSVQWDTALNFIDPGYVEFAQNSNNFGNYNTSDIINTGSNDEYARKNIYDLAGNVAEWIMEAKNDNERTIMGGFYQGSGKDYPASTRGSLAPNSTNTYTGFRICLYF